jgi:hypothetical protein
MDNNRYLIPANSKRSLLIFGLFKKIDLIIFGIGISSTLILMLVLPLTSLFATILALFPGMIAGFLVMPFRNFINVRIFLTELYSFYSNRRIYVWRGWSIRGGSDE